MESLKGAGRIERGGACRPLSRSEKREKKKNSHLQNGLADEGNKNH